MPRSAQVLLALSALLGGAAGMGLQSVLLAYLGLASGHAASGAFGPGVFAAGWCAGAWIAGRHAGRPTRALAALALGGPALGGLCAVGLKSAASAAAASTGLALALVAVAALPQGMLLTLQCRALSRASGAPRLALVYVSNLLGALLGAWWIGLEVSAASGRSAALGVACAVAAASAVCGALGALRTDEESSTGAVATQHAVGDAQAAWIALVTALWVFALEWLCLRLAVLWVGSQLGELTRVVAVALFALALGAALVPRFTHRDARGVLEVLALACIASTWPLWCSPTLDWIVAEVQPAWKASAHWGALADLPLTLALVVPTLAPLGAVLPVLHRAMAGESGARLGRVLGFEAFGALAAGPLLHFVVVPHGGVGLALALAPACALLAALGLARQLALRRGIAAVGALSLVACALAARAPQPALASPKLSDPAFTLRAFAEDAHFAVSVVDDGLLGERTLLTDTFRAAGDGRDYAYMRVLGHLPMLLHPQPERVAVIALGTGTTLGAVVEHEQARSIELFELSPKVVEFAPWFERVNGGALRGEDGALGAQRAARVRVRLGDGRRELGRSTERFDVISIEPLLPDSPFGVYLYTPEFYARVNAALAEDGLFAQWVPPHALAPEVAAAVVEAFARSFEWSSAWTFGTQWILIGGTRAPQLDPARFAALAEPLRSSLAAVGLDTFDGVRARWVADLREWPRSARALSDDDPWIVSRSRADDPPLLEWLPRNFESLTSRATAPPWPANDAADSLARSLAALREARIAHGWREARRRGGELDSLSARELVRTALGADAALAARDPEVRALLDELEFLEQLRAGVAALAVNDARAGLRGCLRAAELRPERADVHLYVAAALHALGQSSGAQAALAKAQQLCPRWRETPQGQRALRLGLPAQ
ncbi:MAG: fused MFS/spermidine synthase [Planctomycetes bacterium]|nr:fused MFS/spermidine synthase [Planctomycetota bacterium]